MYVQVTIFMFYEIKLFIDKNQFKGVYLYTYRYMRYNLQTLQKTQITWEKIFLIWYFFVIIFYGKFSH